MLVVWSYNAAGFETGTEEKSEDSEERQTRRVSLSSSVCVFLLS